MRGGMGGRGSIGGRLRVILSLGRNVSYLMVKSE